MVGVSRFDIANWMKQHWALLSWKGDEHAEGIYFNQQYGYLIERTYAVRIKHDEAAPSVFYIPSEDSSAEDEVTTTFPYSRLTKVTKNYHLLFQGETLEETQLNSLFQFEAKHHVMLEANKLIDMLSLIKKKRERDRTLMCLQINETHAEASLVEKKNNNLLFAEKFEINPDIGCNREKESAAVFVNANTLLHALRLQNSETNVFFAVSSDKMKITSVASTWKVEAVISLSKLKKEITLLQGSEDT